MLRKAEAGDRTHTLPIATGVLPLNYSVMFPISRLQGVTLCLLDDIGLLGGPQGIRTLHFSLKRRVLLHRCVRSKQPELHSSRSLIR